MIMGAAGRLIWQKAWTIIITLLHLSGSYYTDRSVEIYDLTVPRYPKAGDDVTLKCHFHLHGTNHGLYTVNWWRGKDQFYTYKKNSSSPKNVYRFSGIRVNVNKSSSDTVTLLRVSEATSGQYRCEVMGEGPAFVTATHSKRMTVIIPPEKLEIIQSSYRGHPNYYDIGDLIKLNCSAHKSKPKPTMQWLINGKSAHSAGVKSYSDIKDSRGRITSTTELQFFAAQHFINKQAIVTCNAFLEGHKFQIVENLRLNPSGAFYLYSSGAFMITLWSPMLTCWATTMYF